jgi:ferrochelatase
MSTHHPTQQREQEPAAMSGVLLVNLGTPDAPTTSAVRRFLKQFLSDPRVIEYPRLLWWCVLNLVILRIRPARSAAAYRKIWTAAGSPLMVHSETISKALQVQLDTITGNRFHVELAMNYGEPSIGNSIDKLLAAGVRSIVTLPMYPQYSGTTTASVHDTVARKYASLRWIPEVRFINDYHDAPGYVVALANSVRESWAADGRGDKLLMSFHGVPTRTVTLGDPYLKQCEKTARLLADALKLEDDDWVLAFQSRVGRDEWLSPFTDQTLKDLGQQGVGRVDVICPGFAVDCLETLEEIEMQNAALFVANGGALLHYIPALNSRDDHVAFLADLLNRHCT